MLLWDTLKSQGWLEMYPVEMVMLADTDLAENVNDRRLWRFVQEHYMILLTANRNNEDRIRWSRRYAMRILYIFARLDNWRCR